MAYVDVLVAAIVAQILVLPGEKGQLIIAGLSTKYRPVTVVSAAMLAFGLWTAVEIQVGGYVRQVLPRPIST
ncbi:MAG: TMEM165/GDT1 family protein [Halobacteria archaeon]